MREPVTLLQGSALRPSFLYLHRQSLDGDYGCPFHRVELRNVVMVQIWTASWSLLRFERIRHHTDLYGVEADPRGKDPGPA